jgi:hypothetical protein
VRSALVRIAEALERVASALEKSGHQTELHYKRQEAGRKGAAVVARGPGGKFAPKEPPAEPTKTPAKTGKTPAKGQNVGRLITCYVDAWRARYKTQARPEVQKCIGVFQRLLAERSVEELCELVQVYCQMDDKWFGTKHHDIGTFAANISKVVVAHDKGHERGASGERSWIEIAEEAERERNGIRRLQAPD